MGSFSGTCEIVEATDEMTSVQHSEGFYPQRTRDSKGLPPVIRKGSKNSLEDDINKLFEAISLKNSSKGLGLSEQVGASPSRKNTSKRPMRVGASHQSQEIGFSEPVSLKQALRGLCISQAAEMAAVRRLSKPTASPRLSEAGKITSLYRSVVVEAGENGLPLAEGRVEISLMPEASTSHSSPQRLQEPKMKSADQSVCSSPRFNARTTLKSSQSTNLNEILPASAEVSLTPEASTSHSSPQQLQEPKMKSADQSVCSSPRFNATTTLKSSQSTNQNNILPASAELSLMPEASTSHSSPQQLQEPKMKSADQSVCSSPRFNAMRTLKISQSTKQNEILPESAEADSQLSNIVPTLEEKHTSSTSLPHLSDAIEAEAEAEDVGSSTKVCGSQDEFANKVAPKQRRKGRLEAVPSPSTASNNNKAGKRTRNTPRVVKPVVRTKNFVKKKPKQDSNRISSTCGENSSDFSLSTGELICQRCQCALKNTGKESHQLATSASTGVEVSSSNRNLNGINTGFTSKGCDSSSSVVKIIQNSNPREKGEFTQSSKSSIGEHSSSTSLSEESNLSGSTYGNRPHMSKDFRWEAIHHVKKQQGFLGLIHFNLLKKLGSGDIGTVYLAELSGTNCLFAIKVMDNEFLAKRKKMPRAQTEREILRMLDHPFLPTLYAQFVSDNLSCLVMDYCPGGDLHVLRQRQPCRYFPEQAARFYVAEVLLALEYLHMLGIVYRDLKPENILVREDGHIMLTDFDLSLRCSVSPTLLKSPPLTMEPPRISGPCTGSSCIDPFCSGPSCQVSCFSPRLFPTTAAAAKTRKHKLDLAAQARARSRSLPLLVAEPTEARSNSFVGTHEYLAPEIIKGEGHGSAVDWWTFGIFLYELLYGKTPFKGPGNEETLANVVLQSLKFPDTPIVSFQARDLIRGLLVKEPENRFGSERGAAEIKQHPFFEGLNWALIRCTIPPEIPDPVDFGAPKLESRDMLEFELF